MSLRVLIVDDHRLAREAIRTAVLFCRSGHPEIVGEAADGATAFELARRLHPDVITMDINLPDMKGLDVTRKLRAEMPHTKVVVVTMYEEREYQEEAVKAGAISYINKEHLIEELPACLDNLAGRCSALGADHKKRGPSSPWVE